MLSKLDGIIPDTDAIVGAAQHIVLHVHTII